MYCKYKGYLSLSLLGPEIEQVLQCGPTTLALHNFAIISSEGLYLISFS